MDLWTYKPKTEEEVAFLDELNALLIKNKVLLEVDLMDEMIATGENIHLNLGRIKGHNKEKHQNESCNQ